MHPVKTFRYSDGELGLCEGGVGSLRYCQHALTNEAIWFSAYCKNCEGQKTDSSTVWYFRDFQMQLIKLQKVRYGLLDMTRMGVSGGWADYGTGLRLEANIGNQREGL